MAQHSLPPAEKWTDRTDQCHIGTILPRIYQLSTRGLVWLPSTCRIWIQQRKSGNHQDHTILCKLRHQSRIQDDPSSEPRKTGKTRRNDSITWVIKERDGGRGITTKIIVGYKKKILSERTIWRYGVALGMEYHNHKTIEETRLQNNRPFKIMADIGTSAYNLALPPSMNIHNTFHMSLLEPYKHNGFPAWIKKLHQENVKTSPGPPRGVVVPLDLLVHTDPPWSTLSVKFQKVWITRDRSGPGGPRRPQLPLVDQERSGPPWTMPRHFADAPTSCSDRRRRRIRPWGNDRHSIPLPQAPISS